RFHFLVGMWIGWPARFIVAGPNQYLGTPMRSYYRTKSLEVSELGHVSRAYTLSRAYTGGYFPMRLNLFVSAFIAAASMLAAAEAMAQCTTKSIPLPGAALLAPPESSCAFQTASVNAAPSQLDYERQCHRDAGVILRDRLLQLQASVGETVKAINRACPAAVSTAQPGSKPSIPLPRRALLTPPPDLDCTFKDSSNAAAGAPSPTPTEAVAAVRMKLDYERQCYRHNEIILL